jgi:hypothetical protein
MRWCSRLFLFLLLCLPTSAFAQTVLTVDLAAAQFKWTWTPAPTGETATTFRMYCGTVTGVYPLTKDTGNVTALSMPISTIITAPGVYFCRVKTFASTTGLESSASNEVNFRAAIAPTPPSTLTVQ